ncbi:TetR/AcrR family transcriptional regulator [Desulfovibrio subterraneus]|jgi:AcrR family transcriptional regulator|uniref:TetR family transcriptional regulator n=1 Tax=Desulfovibrio subterraneus TaxID=2718620 RepID=A0A7J0BIZ8_9BACT|nr:TetR/AcrR family transcriptional regulator [Desulfovibrio subterraneus]WBF67309.1 TetR/AcrR family transcriptional regulator [Desulfovibrio subterraneus]GFM33064.1 TetR family transcriptional regulator [Desulfovibrio subterraneus]
MQIPDENKRKKIMEAASALFATRPFHKVLLTDVAAEAGVGKGTLYIYFKDKDDLYRSVVRAGFRDVIERIRQQLKEREEMPETQLRNAIGEVVRYAYGNPDIFRLLREAHAKADDTAHCASVRQELATMFEEIIRVGVAKGVFHDPHPELSARFIPGFVRSAFIYGDNNYDTATLESHIMRFVLAGLQAPVLDK